MRGVVGPARWMRGAVVCLACVVGMLPASTGTSPSAVTVAAPLLALPARFTVTGADRPIPRSFLGLSIEYNELRAYEREGSLFDRVVSMIRPEDGARMLLRIGGKSADHVYWQATRAPRPRWVSRIGAGWLSRLCAVVARDHLRVILDLNLAVHSPSLEARFVTAARRALPGGSLAGLEVGNEPDLYAHEPSLEKQRIPGTDVGPGWTRDYSAADYRRDYGSYARTLTATSPGIALGGPETISSDSQWLAAVEGLGRLDPSVITAHRYASSSCWPSTARWYPTIATMLSEKASSGLAASVGEAVAFAHAHRQALRVSELNSISCGGNAGVANSFATALWAPDALFAMVRAGVDGVNWHIRPSTLNAPFLAHVDSIQALPELYGLAAFAQMTRPGAQLLRASLSASPGLDVTGWAVRVPGGTRVLLINKGPRAASVTVSTGMVGHAFLKRLTAPGVGSTAGVTFGGQSIGADGRWHGRLHSPTVAVSNGSSHVDLPGASAAMLSVWR